MGRWQTGGGHFQGTATPLSAVSCRTVAWHCHVFLLFKRGERELDRWLNG